jgi:KDO2-lipid IV(A) lauroyltransferase
MVAAYRQEHPAAKSLHRKHAPRSRPRLAWLCRLSLRVMSFLPLPLSHGLGAGLGHLVASFPNRSKQRVLENLELCFPELDEAQRQRLGRASLASLGRAVCELGPFWHWDRSRLAALVRRVHGADVLSAALERGKGLILATPHLGAWELLGAVLSGQHQLNAVYLPPRIRELDSILRASRERFGVRTIEAGSGALRELFRSLARSEIVVLLPDQSPGRGGGVFAPYFGVPAYTGTLLSRLSHRTGTEVVWTFMERLPRGGGYELHFVRSSDGVCSGDLMTSVRAINADLEALIRRVPEQYLWRYPRFRIRPVPADDTQTA